MIYSRHIQNLNMNQLEIWPPTALLPDWPLELRADLWKKIQDFSARLIWFSIWTGVGFVWITFKSLQMNCSCLCWILHQVCQAQAETLWTSLHLLLSSVVGHELCCFHVLQMSTGLQLLWQAVYYLTLADRFQEYFEKVLSNQRGTVFAIHFRQGGQSARLGHMSGFLQTPHLHVQLQVMQGQK